MSKRCTYRNIAYHFSHKDKPSNQEHIRIEETVKTFIQTPTAKEYAFIKNHEIISAVTVQLVLLYPWKTARVSVIKKQNKHNYYDVNSYRPISVKKTTETALHTLVSEIENGFEGKAATASAVIDIKSAFDTAWPRAILSALISRKFPAYVVKLIQSFQSSRTATLPSGHTTVSVKPNIDDTIRVQFPFNSSMLAFADDLTLSAQNKDPTIATRNLPARSSWSKNP
ncbi:hypothetical protein OUZ56_012053 [Daphnia magna]|uniref:Reverse transcriptase domain-containing protein n=1 Tax=Daphnia magna TaxID=35525 RepID=A0ABQ9Z1X2_9CRUS|nr:hypothetical protein OUZ56_012053 [Daphnia magna]